MTTLKEPLPGLRIPAGPVKQPLPSAEVPVQSIGAAAGALPFLASGGGIPIMPGQFMPPNGFAGFAQQTPAVQSAFTRRGNGSRRRKKKSGAVAKVKGTARKAKAVRGKLKKGSAAAKAYMAKIRKKRKK